MKGVGRALRRHGGLIFFTIFAPAFAVYFALPAKVVDGGDLEDPPYGRYVEVTVDRLEPLPWTSVDKATGAVTGRFVLGWIGKRALLVQAEVETPTGRVLRGYLKGLHGALRKRVEEAPLAAAAYDAVLDMTKPSQRLYSAVGGAVVSLVVLGMWGYRFVPWRRRARPARVKPKLGPRLETDRPRSDEVVAAVMRRHGVLDIVAYFGLYAVTVVAFSGVVVAGSLGFDLWDNASGARHFGMFMLSCVAAAPVTGPPFYWWARRRRAALRRVARNGEIVNGFIVSVSTGEDHSVIREEGTPRLADLCISTSIGGVNRHFRVMVDARPDWVTPGTLVRVLASGDERFAIMIAPTGDDFAGKAHSPWRWRRGGGGDRGAQVPTATALRPRKRD